MPFPTSGDQETPILDVPKTLIPDDFWRNGPQGELEEWRPGKILDIFIEKKTLRIVEVIQVRQ